jgi:UDP-N-acetylmuramoylalanine-D-glutamate ligase
MYLVVIAWIYVVLMMSVAEATNTNGTLLGAIVTFFLYGVGPAALVAYLMGTPARKRAIKKREAEELAAARALAPSTEPDAGSHAARGVEAIAPVVGSPGIAPMRKEP